MENITEKKTSWAEKSDYCASHKVNWWPFVTSSFLLVLSALLMLYSAPTFCFTFTFVTALVVFVLQVYFLIRIELFHVRTLRALYETYFDYCVSLKKVNYHLRGRVAELENDLRGKYREEE